MQVGKRGELCPGAFQFLESQVTTRTGWQAWLGVLVGLFFCTCSGSADENDFTLNKPYSFWGPAPSISENRSASVYGDPQHVVWADLQAAHMSGITRVLWPYTRMFLCSILKHPAQNASATALN